jgi:hypothetical protein
MRLCSVEGYVTTEVIQARWYNAEWLREVHTWIDLQTSELGYEVTGQITQPHVRPWATALRVPTDRGLLWFKATTPALAHESAITQALSGWTSGLTPRVLAADVNRNWLLMEHGGERLRKYIEEGGDRARVREMASAYAGLQKSLVDRVDAMLKLGTPDCRLATFPAHYARLLEDGPLLRVGEEEGLTEVQLARLQDLVPTVEAIASELASDGIPETLQHDDLHLGNVFVDGDQTVIFDWGDSSISHPFFSLVVMRRATASDFDVEEESAEIQEVRSAYLNAWDLPLSHDECIRACLLADALGRISRALTWARLLPGMEEPHRSQYITAVAGWLQEFLESPALRVPFERPLRSSP